MAEQPEDFSDTPKGWAARWHVEIASARQALERWHKQGKRSVEKYLDERKGQDEDRERHLNLFYANVETKQSTLYGQTPKVSVSRRYADANDDVARVAAELLERLLNADIERDGDSYAQALQYALEDRLIPGLGTVRVRYEAEFEQTEEVAAIMAPDGVTVIAPAVPPQPVKTYECAETDYVHWQDFLWSPCRVWAETRWVAFRAELGQAEFDQRFDADGALKLWQRVPKHSRRDDDNHQKQQDTPWDRVQVWEVWDKETRRVFWYVEGYSETLDQKEDPLGLEGFFPCPQPMVANSTTSKFMPRPDYALAQDQYEQINELTARIDLLVGAVRAAGVYDKANGSLQQLLDSSKRNVLIPVDNWAAFSEKGGLRGTIDWMPLEQVVGAIQSLTAARQEAKQDLYEVTGMADIMRGASDPAETARAQGIKARFGSVRLQRLQDEFARFASDVQRLKAEIIAKHFDAATVLAASNAQYTYDADVAQQAVQLLKDRHSEYRVEVKPEAVSLTDFAALKQERMEVLTAIASFLQAILPMAQTSPASLPFLLEMLKWSVAGLRGSSGIEGVLDRAIVAGQQAAAQAQQGGGKPQQPDPKVLAQQLKGQQEMEKVQAELQADLVRTQAEVQANEQKERAQMQYNVREAAMKQQVSNAGHPTRPQESPFGGGK